MTMPCCSRSGTVGNPLMSTSAETTAGMSSAAMPIQSVAQNVKLCSFAIALTLPAPTSFRLPSSPCP